MPRKYKVSLEYQREITRINRNIKAKERRLRAKGYNVRLPVKTKNQFTTKEQVENYLEKQKEVAKTHYYYNKRTRELIPAEKYTELQNMLRDRNAIVKKRYGKVLEEEFTHGGEGKGVTVGAVSRSLSSLRLGNTKYDAIRERNYSLEDIKSEEQLDRTLMNLREQVEESYWEKKDKTFKENYIASLSTVWGDDPMIDELTKKLEDMPLDEFMNHYYRDDLVGITYNYSRDPNYSESDKLIKVLNTWDRLTSQ